MKTTALVMAIGLVATSAGLAAEDKGAENLALRAKIQATSVFNSEYAAERVADGVIPAAMSKADVGKAWCAQGNRHPDGVSLSMEWPQPVEVKEIVYYGRTAWEWEENWRRYEVYLDQQGKPVLKAVAFPPFAFIIKISPRMSKAIFVPSGLTSTFIQVPSSVFRGTSLKFR